MRKDTSEPAFPRDGHPDKNDLPIDGMSLRDYFAAKAMQGMLAHSTRYHPAQGYPEKWHDAISQEAFEIADAMLEAREK